MQRKEKKISYVTGYMKGEKRWYFYRGFQTSFSDAEQHMMDHKFQKGFEMIDTDSQFSES